MPIKVVNETGGVIGTKILDENGIDICSVLGVTGLQINFSMEDGIVIGEFELGMLHTEIKCNKSEWVILEPISGQYLSVEMIRFKNGNTVRFDEEGEISFYKNGEAVSVINIYDGRTFKKKAVPDYHSHSSDKE